MVVVGTVTSTTSSPHSPPPPPPQSSIFNFGRANETVAQIRDPEDASSCLAYDGSTLHMEACRVETGDAPNATDCLTHNCRFSDLTDQLFYRNRLGQLSLAWTNFQAPRGLPSRRAATNIPMCLVTEGGSQPLNPPSTSPSTSPAPYRGAVNESKPLQVWAGPLAGGDFAVVLLNTGDTAARITASFADIGVHSGVDGGSATDLFTGADVEVKGAVSATVGSHDVAAFRLTPHTSV